MSKSTVEILREARALITPEAARCKEVWCYRGGRTVSYCAVGALGAAAGFSPHALIFTSDWRQDIRVTTAIAALVRVLGGRYCNDVFRFNDRSEHAELLALFDRAIGNEEARAQEFTAEPLPEPIPVA